MISEACAWEDLIQPLSPVQRYNGPLLVTRASLLVARMLLTLLVLPVPSNDWLRVPVIDQQIRRLAVGIGHPA